MKKTDKIVEELCGAFEDWKTAERMMAMLHERGTAGKNDRRLVARVRKILRDADKPHRSPR